MRVLLDVSAVPPRPVGVGTYAVHLGHELVTRPDLDLTVLAARGDAARWRAALGGGHVRDAVPARRPARLAWEQVRAPGLAARCGVDVWHGIHYTMPLRLPVPAVVTVHDLTFLEHPEWHERAKVGFFVPMLRAAVRRAAVLVAVSHDTERRLRALLDPRAPVVVVHHGVDHARFRPGPVDGDDEVLAGLGVRRPYVAFVGTLEPRKDVPSLVRAFARVAARHPDLQLALAGGDGWGAEDVRRAIASSGVATRVARLGYVPAPALPALVRNAAVFAYPSLAEGFGLNVVEGMASGVPVVTTTGSATEEVAGDAAILVPPGDVGALADALGRALEDRDLRARLAVAGPARAAAFTWAASADGHLAAYRRALGEAA